MVYTPISPEGSDLGYWKPWIEGKEGKDVHLGHGMKPYETSSKIPDVAIFALLALLSWLSEIFTS